MKARSLLTTAALFAAALFIIDVPAANAADRYFYHGGAAQAWSSANWYQDAAHTKGALEPTRTDHAIIEADCYLGADEVCQSFAVDDGVTLELANGATGYMLEVGDQDGRTSTVDGTVLLSDDTSKLEFDYAHTVSTSDSGDIDGAHNSARIDITGANDTVTISSGVTVHGAMQIRAGSGTFDNDGLVEADAAAENDNTIECYDGTFAGGSGTYKVATSGATLKFASGITADSMSAAFDVGGGTLDMDDDDVDTSGGLTFTDGTIDVAAGARFEAG